MEAVRQGVEVLVPAQPIGLRGVTACVAGRLILAGLLSVALFGVAAPAAAAPMDGKGQWVWYVSQSGGSAEAIAERAANRSLSVVYVKSGDGRDYWEQFSPQLVAALHARGIKACAWHYVYGTHPKGEAAVSAQAAVNGADCLVIDAETEYSSRYAQAHAYITELRRRVGPGYPIGLSSFPWVDYHLNFPYSVFMGNDGAQFNLPQIYWHTIGTSVQNAVEHTYLWNRPYNRELYPVGQTYADPPSRELGLFRRFMNEYGAPGESWWSWQETSRREFRKITKPLTRGVKDYAPVTSFPLLKQGSRGDLVVLAQELLLAHGAEGLYVDGVFGKKTTDAVIELQTRSGFVPTGQIGDTTWPKLLEREPVSTPWSERRRLGARGAGSDQPRSAGDPAQLEFAPPKR